MPYITAADISNAVGPQVYLACFDDTNSGVVLITNPGVVQIIARAHTEVLSYLPAIWGSLPDETKPAPLLLWSCELDFAQCLTYCRHPYYANAYGNDPTTNSFWKRAAERMARIVAGTQRTTDTPDLGTPVNIGGILVDSGERTFVPNADGTPNRGDM